MLVKLAGKTGYAGWLDMLTIMAGILCWLHWPEGYIFYVVHDDFLHMLLSWLAEYVFCSG